MHREELATARAGRTGREVVTAHQVDLVAGALSGSGRILEVGCGRGELAIALAGRGYDVTAIDPALADDVVAVPGVRFERIEIERFTDAERYDAVAFTASLHHVAALGPALDAAIGLLGPRGILVIDEFDLRAPDEAAALWFFEIQELFAVAGLYDPSRIDGSPSQQPLARWIAAHSVHAHHGHGGAHHPVDHPLHDGAAMIAAIRERCTTVEISGGPYLYRHMAAGIRGPRAPWIVEAIRDAEKRRIGLGLMPPVGLAITARARPR